MGRTISRYQDTVRKEKNDYERDVRRPMCLSGRPVPAKHVLPPLPYAHAALEPTIDARTMMLHHDKHHASYVEKLNAALEKFPELQGRTASWLLLNLIKVLQNPHCRS
jgi:hypothetical protein